MEIKIKIASGWECSGAKVNFRQTLFSCQSTETEFGHGFWNEVPPRRNCFSEEENRGLMTVEGQ